METKIAKELQEYDLRILKSGRPIKILTRKRLIALIQKEQSHKTEVKEAINIIELFDSLLDIRYDHHKDAHGKAREFLKKNTIKTK